MQNKVKKFNTKKYAHKNPMSIYARLLDTQSEMGELAKEYLKNTNYGTKNFDLTEDFLMEYGDVLYCLLSLANELNVDAKKCLDMAISKYQKRLNKKQNIGSDGE